MKLLGETMKFVEAVPKGRLATSSACRNWYHLRRESRKNGTNPPIWVIASPPWAVLRLALKMAGKPASLGFLLWPLGLLAGNGDEVAGTELQDAAQVSDDHQDRALGDELVSALSSHGFLHRFRLKGAD